jgi:hypothetical protein
MKKITLANDLKIMGVGKLAAGTVLKVQSYNKRYIYVDFCGSTLKLTYKDIVK